MESPCVDAHGVDYTRPVLPQLDQLGDRYWEWSHEHLTPAFRKRLAAAQPDTRWPGSFPIFASRWLDAQTHIRWQHVLLLWGTVVLVLGFLGLRQTTGTTAPVAAWFGGLVLWTFVEYALHRFLFHRRPSTPAMRRFHFLAHGIHHKDPWDPTRLVFPLLGGAMIASGLQGLLLLVMPAGPALLAMSGLLVGYLAYDLGHYAWHHGRSEARWFRYLKRYHLAHHFRDQDSRYGVSQPLWDLVFRSGDPRV
jgi:sterol desaturase/sphingolipid hydroxylase (fatty acid hydroxylase superfamily)